MMFYALAATLLSLVVPVYAPAHAGELTREEILERIKADPPDVIIVLGSKVVPGRNLKRRVDGAADIASTLGVSVDFIVTGGNAMGRPPRTEAAAMAEQLVTNHGISPDKIIKEDKARTTIENAMYTVRILKRSLFLHALIVTTTENEANHAARALRNFRAARAAVEAEGRFRLSAVSWPYEGGPEPWLSIEPRRP